jgi:group I intron endonuclease
MIFIKKISHNKYTYLKTNYYIKGNFNSLITRNLNTRFYSVSKQNSFSRIDTFLKSKNLNPVFIYDNLEDNNIRKQISLETKGLSGIYLILNKETLAFYVGSASTNKFYSRFTNHLIYFNGSKVLKNSVNKYKLFNFCFIVLELFPEVVTQENNKNLLDLEDFYLKSLLPDYNILTEAGSSFGYKHTEVSRLQMKSVYSEERRKKLGELNKGKTFSPETLEAMRQAALIRKNRDFSKEAILNLKKNSKAILVKVLSSGIIYGRYTSITAAALALNCSSKTIQRSLKSPSKQLKRRWIVCYD